MAQEQLGVMAADDWAAGAGGEPGTSAGGGEYHRPASTRRDPCRTTFAAEPDRSQQLPRAQNRIGAGPHRLDASASAAPEAPADFDGGRRGRAADCMRKRS